MRLMLVLMVALFAYLMLRVVRIISRTGGIREDEGVFGAPKRPAETFSDVKDADFEELKPPSPKDDSTGPTQ
ncbi:MAG: hypothetical protein ACKVRP_12685 [Bacteroidota bacterium]